jgi:hypothetical protein
MGSTKDLAIVKEMEKIFTFAENIEINYQPKIQILMK